MSADVQSKPKEKEEIAEKPYRIPLLSQSNVREELKCDRAKEKDKSAIIAGSMEESIAESDKNARSRDSPEHRAGDSTPKKKARSETDDETYRGEQRKDVTGSAFSDTRRAHTSSAEKMLVYDTAGKEFDDEVTHHQSERPHSTSATDTRRQSSPRRHEHEDRPSYRDDRGSHHSKSPPHRMTRPEPGRHQLPPYCPPPGRWSTAFPQQSRSYADNTRRQDERRQDDRHRSPTERFKAFCRWEEENC